MKKTIIFVSAVVLILTGIALVQSCNNDYMDGMSGYTKQEKNELKALAKKYSLDFDVLDYYQNANIPFEDAKSDILLLASIPGDYELVQSEDGGVVSKKKSAKIRLKNSDEAGSWSDYGYPGSGFNDRVTLTLEWDFSTPNYIVRINGSVEGKGTWQVTDFLYNVSGAYPYSISFSGKLKSDNLVFHFVGNVKTGSTPLGSFTVLPQK